MMGITELCNALEQLDNGERRWHDVKELQNVLGYSQGNIRRIIRSNSGVHVECSYVFYDGCNDKIVVRLLD